jgi:predicted nucleic acid-binding protein
VGPRGGALIRTFIDAGVLISATTGRDVLFDRAWEILDDPERVLLTSELVRLEVVPKAIYFHHPDELDVYMNFFTSVAESIALSEALLTQAHLEAQSAGLGALDALHVAAAKVGGAEEFVTTERLTTALFRVVGLKITTIRPVRL